MQIILQIKKKAVSLLYRNLEILIRPHGLKNVDYENKCK